MSNKLHNQSEPEEVHLYQAEEGQTLLETRLQDETVWLNQKRMAELFQKNVRTINEHIQNIFDEGELVPESVIRFDVLSASIWDICFGEKVFRCWVRDIHTVSYYLKTAFDGALPGIS